MTVLGKILVIVNLVFSLVTGALLIAVFAKGANYKKDYDDLAKELRVANATTKAVEEEALAEKKKCAEKVTLAENQGKALAKRVANELKLAIDDNQSLDKVEADLADKIQQEIIKKHDKDVATEKNRADAEHQHRVSVEGVNKRLQDEVDGLQKTLAERNKRVGDLLDESKKYRDDSVAATLRANSLQDRNEQLRGQIEALIKENEQRRVAGGNTGRPGAGSTADKNPPPEDVRGKVKAVDPSGLITIDKGTDDGINKDNTLEVFRLGSEPKYLGAIRIVAANAHEAVGRPITPQRRGLIQVNDEFASNILGRR
jgi:hypothetical protein